MEYAFGDITVACSNVDRVMFPADGITKGELLAYYRDVAELMVPELRGRPLSVVRYTKGIDRGGFFQKHYQKHFPAWLDRARAGSKTVVEYPVVDSAAGVVYMANQGAVEFHIWTSRKDALDPTGGSAPRPADPALRADGIRLRDLRARLDRRGDPWRALRARAGIVAVARRALAELAGGEDLAPPG